MKRISLLDPSIPVSARPSRALGTISLVAIVGTASTAGTGCFQTGTAPYYSHDSGTPVFDGGIVPVDAGVDSGSTVFDAGIAPPDAGVDSGSTVFDGGMIALDATPDAG